MHLKLWQPLKQALLPWPRSQTVQIWILAEISAMLWLPISKDDLDNEQRLWKLSTTTEPAHAGHRTSAQLLHRIAHAGHHTTSAQLLHRPAHAGHRTSARLLHQLCSSSLLLGLSPSAPSMELNSRLLSCFPTQHSLFVSEFVASTHACTCVHTHLTYYPAPLFPVVLVTILCAACLLLSSIQHFKEGRSFASFSFTANN